MDKDIEEFKTTKKYDASKAEGVILPITVEGKELLILEGYKDHLNNQIQNDPEFDNYEKRELNLKETVSVILSEFLENIGTVKLYDKDGNEVKEVK